MNYKKRLGLALLLPATTFVYAQLPQASSTVGKLTDVQATSSSMDWTTIFNNLATPIATIVAAGAAILVFFQQKGQISKGREDTRIQRLVDSGMSLYTEHTRLMTMILEIWGRTTDDINVRTPKVQPLAELANSLLESLERIVHQIGDDRTLDEIRTALSFYSSRRHAIEGAKYAFDTIDNLKNKGLSPYRPST